MKILLYGINYHPELIGIGKYSSEMCEWLAQQGNDVEIITAMPYYPNWKISDAYKSKGWFTERIKNVRVHRCPLYVTTNVTGFTRIIHEISFGLSSLVYWIPCLFRKYDAIICISPPLQLGLAGVIYRAFHKTLVINHIQDLQLDAAKQLGLIKNKIILSLVGKFEKFILRKSHFVSSISDGMIRNIISKDIPSEKIITFRNWIDTNQMVPEQPDPTIKERFGIRPSQKIVLYSGNIGEKQGIDNIILVAELLRDSEIVFLIIGDGAYKSKLEDQVISRKLENIKMFPLQPIELLGKILNVADIHLVLQKKAAADLVMPSKLTAILSVGGLAIVAAEEGTTLFDIISKNEMGIVIEPENLFALRDSILTCINADQTRLRKNARQYAITNLEKSVIMQQFQSFLKAKVYGRSKS